MKTFWHAVVLVLALFVAGWADDNGLSTGGTVVVDGKTLINHFAWQGDAMLFPVVELASALHKPVQVHGNTVVVNGVSMDGIVWRGTPYLGYQQLAVLFPGLKFGATPGKAVFVSRVSRVPLPHLTASNPPNPAPAGPITLVSDDPTVSQARDNKLTIEATVINATNQMLPEYRCTLVITDEQGTTGTSGQPRTYATYELPLGALWPNQVKKLVFDTDIRDPQDIDKVHQRFVVNVNGLDIQHTAAVALSYKFQFDKTQP